MLGLALFVPFLNALFHFEPLPLAHLALTLALVSAVLLLFAAVSRMRGQTKPA
jgi:hypothetical protein